MSPRDLLNVGILLLAGAGLWALVDTLLYGLGALLALLAPLGPMVRL